MKLKPLYDRIIIRRAEADGETATGLIIPDQAKEKPLEGIVEAVGLGRPMADGTMRPLSIKEGERVLYSRYAGTEIILDEKPYLVIREDDVFGIVGDAL